MAEYGINDVVRVRHISNGRSAEVRGTDLDNWKKNGFLFECHVRREAGVSQPEKTEAPKEPEAPKVLMVADLDLEDELKDVLVSLGVNTAEELASIDDDALLAFEPIGKVRLRRIRKALGKVDIED